MADKRISQLIERVDIANNDVLPIVASGATTTNKVTISTIQDWMQSNLDVGVTSVGLTMPSAFQVSGSPITTSGNISVTATGTASQYIRGDGTLADFPQGGGGGGASVSYYLNGSVSQGTIGGVAYLEMNKTPILGTGTDFNISADGYIASFITDAYDPALLEIPAGNWNFETYFQASSAGGTPSFYIELYKVSGATATLIASNSGNPELIAFGTSTTPYFSALAVPQTTLTLTDRLAIRIYVVASGRTITLHTENSNLCQIITTFTTGLTALNGLTAQVQNFATGTSGTDFNISSTGSTHTFNLPDASASNRGAVTTGTQTFAGYKIFNGTIGVNNDLQLATVGTALNTFIKNINSTGLTSIGSNGFGFNNANNIYFSGSSKGGGVFAFSNTGTQTYTLPDASGTIALTSNLSSYLPLSGGTLTGALNGTSASFNTTNAVTLTASDSRIRGGDTTGRLLLANSGTTTYGIFHGSSHATNPNAIQFYNDNTLSLSLASTGAATFSSSVTASSVIAASATFSNFGSATSAVVGFGDANTGFFRPAANSLSITTNGVQRQIINSDGAMGFNYPILGSRSFVFRTISGRPLTLETIAPTGIHSLYLRPNDSGRHLISSNYLSGGVYLPLALSGRENDADFVLSTSGNVGIGTASPSNGLLVLNSTASNGVRFALESSGTMNGIVSIGSNAISGLSTTDMGLWTRGAMAFETGASGEKMRITSGGNVLINKTSDNGGRLQSNASSQTNQWLTTSGVAWGLINDHANAGAQFFVDFRYNGTGIGSIQGNNTGVSYISASDYRLKENVKPVKNALSVLTQLKPCTFNFIADEDKEIMGFIAHEVQELIPQAVTGEKDEVRIEQVEVSPAELDEEGNVITEAVIEEKEVPVYQGIDHSKLVPLLVAAIQELKAEIEALKSQING